MLGLLRRLRSKTSTPALARCAWAALLIIHAPALILAWLLFVDGGTESIRLSSFLGLNLATLFFVLKIRGVRLLELQTDRRSLLAIAVAVGLMHAHAVGARLQYVAVPQDVSVAAGVLFATGFARLQRVLGTLVSRGRVAAKTTRLRAQPVQCYQRRPRWLPYTARLCTPRAPPLSSTPR
jgi:hypothetical protein